jgi:hypothetical protein
MPAGIPLRHARLVLLEWLIIRAVPVLNRVRPPSDWPHSLEALRRFPAASWGAELAAFLDARGFADFLPNYEAHDTFHALLRYDTTVVGELRLQAFMAGNRSPSQAGYVLLVLGGLLVPELWPQLRCDVARGRRSARVRDWHVPAHLRQPIHSLREQLADRVDVITPLAPRGHDT